MSSTLNTSIIPSVTAILVLDSEGNRVCVKYYDTQAFGAYPQQLAFERKMFTKIFRSQSVNQTNNVQRTDADIAAFDGFTIVYKPVADVCFYVIGTNHPNSQSSEVLLHTMLTCLDDAASQLFNQSISKKNLIENLDSLLLLIDEMIDSGLILEMDSSQVVQHVESIHQSSVVNSDGSQVPLAEQSFTQALQTAKDQLVKSFR